MQSKPITACLWFNGQAEEAAEFYTSVFKNSKVNGVSRYGKEGYEVHRQKEGTVLTVDFELNGQPFTALNGGPDFSFSEAISFQVFCETQDEIDYFWNKFTADGGQESVCGWLKDRFGLSWQIVPSILPELMRDVAKAGKVMEAFLQMKKLNIEKLKEVAHQPETII
jgi:predicted 3-demethylubiquinone-9 3-methyltransferase (glyoxalase superfamily)